LIKRNTEEFLYILVATSTQNQAFNALLFLYRSKYNLMLQLMLFAPRNQSVYPLKSIAQSLANSATTPVANSAENKTNTSSISELRIPVILSPERSEGTERSLQERDSSLRSE